MDIRSMKRAADVAAGRCKADLVIKRANYLDVFAVTDNGPVKAGDVLYLAYGHS